MMEGAQQRRLPGRVLLVFVSALICAAPATSADKEEEQAEIGREIYTEFCASCHGRDLVSPGTLSFDLRRFPKNDFERFRNAVLNGKGQGMPAWRDKIGDDDVASLWAYVRSGG